MLRRVIVISALCSFFTGQLAFAAAPAINMAGQVQGAGIAEMKTDTGWISVSGKSFPLVTGSDLVTGLKGGMTITLNNGVRIEAGKNSEVIVSGNSSVEVRRGFITWNVPQSAELTVTTVQGKTESGAFSKGFLAEGKNTYVKSIAGSITVASNVDPMVLSPGEMVEINGTTGAITPIKMRTKDVLAAIKNNVVLADTNGAAGTGAAAGGGSGVSTKTLAVLGGLVLGGAVAAGVSMGHGGSSSPY